MFVRVKKIGAYEYLYLVENAREGSRHVQRVHQSTRPAAFYYRPDPRESNLQQIFHS